jgi:dihydroorotate dehydrogenase (NAD+) catalytic subunit
VNLAPSHPDGLHLGSPVLTAAGTFGFGDEYRDIVDLWRLGAIVTKTVTPKPREDNPTPRTVETPAGMLNSIGLPNPGPTEVVRQKASMWGELPCPVIVSIAAHEPAGWTDLAARFDGLANVVALEANLSCPNVDGGLDFSATPDTAAATVAAVCAGTRLPVIAKLSPNVTDLAPIAQAVEGAGAHALSLINTVVGMVIDVEAQRPLLGATTGGLSGPAIRPIAVRCVFQVARVVAVPIIGIGGIATTDDALQFILAGASAVQVGTATFRNPLAAQEIDDGLASYLRTHGLGSLQDLVGAALPGRTRPGADAPSG